MSGPEIVHRVQEGLRRRKDRGAAIRLRRSLSGEADAALPQVPVLRDGLVGWDVPTDVIDDWEA
jgi:hypothetical protein